MELRIHLKKVTDDPTHPFPWKWYFEEDTLVGHVTDEGLAASPSEAEEAAVTKFEDAVADLAVQGRTHTTRKVEVNIDKILDDTKNDNYWQSSDAV